MRPVLFEPREGWIGFEKRCISLIGDSNLGKKGRERDKAKEKEEKEKRRIYFAGIPDLQSVQQRIDNLDNGGGGSESNMSMSMDLDDRSSFTADDDNVDLASPIFNSQMQVDDVAVVAPKHRKH
jgi:hypothetical protein